MNPYFGSAGLLALDLDEALLQALGEMYEDYAGPVHALFWTDTNAALSRPGEDHELLIRRLKRHGDAAGSRASIDELLIALGEYQIPHSTYTFWFDAYRDYRASPEFKRHLRRLGLPEFWRANGFPPMCRPLGEEDFECD